MDDFPIWLKALIYLLIGATALTLGGGLSFILRLL
jgi:hypothetical protein